MNSYELSRYWFEFSFNNPDKIKPAHSAVYFFAIEHCNRLGWKQKFGFPSQMVMEAIGIKNWRTYSQVLNELVEWGFIEMIEISKNQYSSNIIAIVNFTKAPTKALDKALSKHGTKQSPKHSQGTVSIDKQETIEQGTIEQEILQTPKGDSFDYHLSRLLESINNSFGKQYRVINDKTKAKYKTLLKNYKWSDVVNAIKAVKLDKFHIDSGYKYATPEFFSRPDKIDMYGFKSEVEKKYTGENSLLVNNIDKYLKAGQS